MIECYEISVPVYMCEGVLDAIISFTLRLRRFVMIECYEISVPVYMCEGVLNAIINFYFTG